MIVQEILTARSNPQEDLDTILAKCCEMVLDGQTKEPDYYGMVAACAIGPNGEKIYGLNYADDKGTRVHAERAAIDKSNAIGPEWIIVTTLSPCNRPMDERSGDSCEDLLKDLGINHVYCGYKDPTQDHDKSVETKNTKLRELCKKLADTFLKKTVQEQVVEESTNAPGEYVYHAGYLPNQRQGLRSIINTGLMPSKTGYAGPGVYFAYKPEDCYYHVGKDEATMFRVRWTDLVKLYGTYPDNTNGIERDDDEIIVPGQVPAGILEVEYFPGEWWDLKSAFQASLGPIDEVTSVPTVAKSKRQHLDVMPNDGKPIPQGDESSYMGDLVAEIGKGYQLWSWADRGTVTYYVYDTVNRICQLATTGRPYKTNRDSFVVQGVYSGPKNKFRAADLYAFLILDQGLTLVSDNKQSAGGYRVWQELEHRYKDINVHGFDTKTNQGVNVTTQDEPDTHVDRATVKTAGPQMKKELGSISRDLRFVASKK